MSGRVLLVRHTQVASAWKGRCYGHSDVGLSRIGAVQAQVLAQTLAQWHPDIVVHSGLRRTRILAEKAANLAGVSPIGDVAWQERDFGSWEGRGWSSIFRESGNAMDGMIDDPYGFRPGSGETTMELAARCLTALQGLPSGRVMVVTHGGPIAAIVGTQQGVPGRDWPSLVPDTGAFVELPQSRAGVPSDDVAPGSYACFANSMS
jgi:broad specificity phosphatase PhoE